MTRIASAIAFAGTLAVLSVSISVAQAGRFSWFDEPYAAERLWLDGVATRPTANALSIGFGDAMFRSFAASRIMNDESGHLAAEETHFEPNAFYLYGELGEERAVGVLVQPSAGFGVETTGESQRLSVLAAKWQRRLTAIHSVSLAASYAETPSAIQSAPDFLDTRAALSWTSKWGDGMRPGITGSVFVGDESARDAAYHQIGRRYFGFSLAGELSPFRDHTQYLSFRTQRYLYSDSEEIPYGFSRLDEGSLLAAGWRWQVQRNWSVHAEANFGLNGTNQDSLYPQYNRVIFGTRFDFR
jgi:hypothetical protein